MGMGQADDSRTTPSSLNVYAVYALYAQDASSLLAYDHSTTSFTLRLRCTDARSGLYIDNVSCVANISVFFMIY